MKTKMIFGVMNFMIKGKRIPSSSRITNNTMKTDYRPKTIELMILKVRKMMLIMKIWALGMMEILMMTSQWRMMIAPRVRKTRLSMITIQTPDTALRLKTIAQKILISQEQQH